MFGRQVQKMENALLINQYYFSRRCVVFKLSMNFCNYPLIIDVVHNQERRQNIY